LRSPARTQTAQSIRNALAENALEEAGDLTLITGRGFDVVAVG
jgi:hypothetical protein